MDVKDYVMSGIIIFGMAVVFIIIHYSWGVVSDKLVNNTQINSSSSAVDAIQSTTTNVTNRLDYVVFMIFIGLVLALLISGYFMGAHPIFMFIYFIVIILVVAFSAIMSNVWDSLSARAMFVNLIPNSFPITNHLITNLPLYSIIIGLVGLIVMFSRPFLQEV